jgi:FMN phosphatase YigB (HAD superfamily)
MLDAILFDLDNTLIHFDENEFFKRYMRSLAPRFSDIWTFEPFYSRMIESVQALLKNDGSRTNAERFMDHFAAGHEPLRASLWDRFEAFYATEFDSLRELVTVREGVVAVLSSLEAYGVRMVIASNPVWPLSVQRKRLAWAGLVDFSFDLITHIENMGFCKPNTGYYREIAGRLEVAPEACLMVGNDPVNDMAAAGAGMRTYLIRDVRQDGSLPLSRTLRKNESPGDFKPDFEGPLEAVENALRTLMAVENPSGKYTRWGCFGCFPEE